MPIPCWACPLKPVSTPVRRLHAQADRINLFTQDGQEWIELTSIRCRQPQRDHSREARVTGRKSVKNTSGITEERLVIQTAMTSANMRSRWT